MYNVNNMAHELLLYKLVRIIQIRFQSVRVSGLYAPSPSQKFFLLRMIISNYFRTFAAEGSENKKLRL